MCLSVNSGVDQNQQLGRCQLTAGTVSCFAVSPGRSFCILPESVNQKQTLSGTFKQHVQGGQNVIRHRASTARTSVVHCNFKAKPTDHHEAECRSVVGRPPGICMQPVLCTSCAGSGQLRLLLTAALLVLATPLANRATKHACMTASSNTCLMATLACAAPK
jgi:hypothetical protein